MYVPEPECPEIQSVPMAGVSPSFTDAKWPWYGMTIQGDEGSPQHASAETFSALGHETRVAIIHALAEADSPLSFTELRNRVGIDTGRQFNYHLEQLVGHFVNKTGEGYSLTQPGERVVEAVRSGVVTRDPIEKEIVLDEDCYRCGGRLKLMQGGHLALYCTECQGNVSLPPSAKGEDSDHGGEPEGIGLLRGFELPPAGMQARSDLELLRAGNIWSNLEVIASSVGVCPRCSAPMAVSLRICDAHDREEGCCAACGHRYAVKHIHECTTCPYARMRHLGLLLLGTTEVLDFFTDHDINPIAPASPMSMRGILDAYEEEVISIDPFMGRFTFAIGEEALSVTVDDDMAVVESRRQDISESE